MDPKPNNRVQEAVSCPFLKCVAGFRGMCGGHVSEYLYSSYVLMSYGAENSILANNIISTSRRSLPREEWAIPVVPALTVPPSVQAYNRHAACVPFGLGPILVTRSY